MNSRHSRSGGDRATRVAEQIHHELAQMISREVKDPRIGMVTINSVAITPEYGYATVHFTVLPSDETTVARTLEGLRSCAGFLHLQLRRRVRTHTTPELRFVHDVSVERGVGLSRLIDEANAVRAADDGVETVTVVAAEGDADVDTDADLDRYDDVDGDLDRDDDVDGGDDTDEDVDRGDDVDSNADGDIGPSGADDATDDAPDGGPTRSDRKRAPE